MVRLFTIMLTKSITRAASRALEPEAMLNVTLPHTYFRIIFLILDTLIISVKAERRPLN